MWSLIGLTGPSPAVTSWQKPWTSHDLAALSITEAVIHGLHTNKQPVYILLLDAQSAFDRVVIEHAIRCAYLAGTADEGLVYLDRKLTLSGTNS